MICHSYYTSGMHELAKVFVESFYYHHKNEVPLVIDAVGIDDAMEKDLTDLHPLLKIRRRDYHMKFWSKKHGIPLAALENWKREVGHNHVTQENRGWKLLIAGQERVSAVRDFVSGFAEGRHPHLVVHFDIDTLFRAPIFAIQEEMEGFDVGLKLRPTIQPIKARITIDMMAFSPSVYVMMWLQDWLRIICSTPLLNRPVGFGQSSCWEAYEQAIKENRLKVFTLPVKYGLPGLNKKEHVVWCGNVHKLTKDDCAKEFRAEFNRIKKEDNE